MPNNIANCVGRTTFTKKLFTISTSGLVLHQNMPNPIPPPLASYISGCLTPSNAHSAILLTSTLSTPSPWLTLRFIYAALYGTGDDGLSSTSGVSRRTVDDLDSSNNGYPVIFVSLLRPLALWVEIGKKLVRAVRFPLFSPSYCLTQVTLMSFDTSQIRRMLR